MFSVWFVQRVCAVGVAVAASTTPAFAKAEKIFRFANGAEVQSLDPVLMDDASSNIIGRAVFEGLVRFDPVTTDPLPAIAEKWDIAKDGLTYTFNLRKNAKWSNGDIINANDFVWSWKRVLDPATGAYSVQSFTDAIVGAGEYYSAKGKRDWNKVGIKALDDFTLQVKLKRPNPFFIDDLSSAVFAAVPQKSIEKHGKSWAKPENLLFSGPFTIKEWRHKEVMILEKNPTYWGANDVHVDRIEVFPIENDSTGFNMYKLGQIDWIRYLPANLLNEVKKHPDQMEQLSLRVAYLRMNITNPVLKDARVRRAISMAINRKVIAEKVVQDGKAIYTFVPPQVRNAKTIASISEDVAAAKKLLTEAGYPDGKGFPAVEIVFQSSPTSSYVSQVIGAMLKKALNINVSPKSYEKNTFYDKMDHLKYDIAIANHGPSMNDPEGYLTKFTSENTYQNLTGYASKDYDKLIEQALNEVDLAKRSDYWAQADKLLSVEDCAVVPLYNGYIRMLVKPYVTGIVPNLLNAYTLRNVDIKKTTN